MFTFSSYFCGIWFQLRFQSRSCLVFFCSHLSTFPPNTFTFRLLYFPQILHTWTRKQLVHKTFLETLPLNQGKSVLQTMYHQEQMRKRSSEKWSINIGIFFTGTVNVFTTWTIHLYSCNFTTFWYSNRNDILLFA